jgi:hypothetical protein
MWGVRKGFLVGGKAWVAWVAWVTSTPGVENEDSVSWMQTV